MTETFIITLFAGPRAVGVTAVDSISLIGAEIARLREVLALEPHDRTEVARWQPHDDRRVGWLLRETFEWR